MPGHVLIVSYYSPPFGGTQSFRLNQFVKHLPAYGWDCTVLTATSAAFQTTWRTFQDTQSYSLAAARLVRRVPALPLERIAARLRAASERYPSWDGADTGVHASSTHRSAPGLRTIGRLGVASLAAKIVSVVANPDSLVGWAPGAVISGLPLADGADLIYACGPPYTNHIVAATISLASRTPLVVMVDDPWVSMGHRVWRSGLQRSIQERQERFVLTRSAAVFTGTEGFRADIVARLGQEVGQKTHVIEWGYDPDDYPAPTDPMPRTGVTELLYTGSLRGEQYDISTLLRVVRRMLDRDPALAARLRIRLVGGLDPAYAALIERLSLTDVVCATGFVPHSKLPEISGNATALLLVINDSRPSFAAYTSGKLFHYMALGKPVIALVPRHGEAAQMVRKKGLGVVADPHDERAIESALARLLDDPASLSPSRRDCSEYASPHLIMRAAEIFDLVTRRRRDRRAHLQ